MRPFRFRADAVLGLRQKQEEKARRLLGLAQESHAQAEARQDAAIEQERHAIAQAEAAQLHGLEAWRLDWHRNWIAKQRREADACRRATAISAASVAHASTALNQARQQRRVIERLRERARRRYDLEATREENKTMDDLAGIRFAAASLERQERE
jgi:flagellar export protein FliJ